ncbi:MAG: holo-[acyl-carrier protein] synthase [Frankiales bacterium]|nr:holo-[acyl-carrier protein] synthase [Frankiales bacterium]
MSRVVGVGIDLVDVTRFAASLERTPRLADRLFTDVERQGRTTESLAARFAAKEAVAKVLGAPGNLEWHDVVVDADHAGRPVLLTRGSVAAAASAQGIDSWDLSLTHDGGLAMAVVIAQGPE